MHAVNESDSLHAKGRDFMEERIASGEVLYLAWPTLLGFLRLATHPSVFPSPLSQEDAEANVSVLLEQRNVRTLSEAPGFWQAYGEVTAEAGPIRAKLVPDAHVATILRQHGVRRFYTRDRDYRRFDFLDVIDPLA